MNPTNLTFSQFCVLGDALSNLAEHFAAGGMAERQAQALAHKALQIDPKQWRAATTAHRREQRAQAAALDRFTRKAAAFTASYASRVPA